MSSIYEFFAETINLYHHSYNQKKSIEEQREREKRFLDYTKLNKWHVFFLFNSLYKYSLKKTRTDNYSETL